MKNPTQLDGLGGVLFLFASDDSAEELKFPEWAPNLGAYAEDRQRI